MAKKDFHLLLVFENKKFQANLVKELRPVYTVAGALTAKDLFAKLRRKEWSMVVIDHEFSHMKTDELQQKIVRLCPHIVFVVYSHLERDKIAEQLKRYRAIDYILFTPKVFDFAEKVHKAVRWTVLQKDIVSLSGKITTLADSIKTLSKKIEEAY